MKVKDIIQETPLPDDWDKDVYSPNVSFAKRIRYAKERAKKLGTGSSRVAFEIPYKGRMTVLKIAKNRKGMAQNEVEAKLMSDYYLQGLQIVIPMIDYDEKNSMPTWIHMEKAEKMTLPKFRKFTGGADFYDLVDYALEITGNAGIFQGHRNVDDMKVNPELEFVSDFHDLVANYHGAIEFADMKQKSNWGIYKGNPVIIDVGLSSDVYIEHYKSKPAW